MEGKPPIRSSKGLTNVASTLAILHERLDVHFQELAARRQQLPDEPRIYAIEHGLPPGDLAVLRDVVESCISRSHAPGRHWLPFVVYATEIGYSYEGDEYWPTLEAQAPGWERHLGRQYVKARFQQFEVAYHGASPTGRWASQFTIICWPITHAILPTDLQRQFARLLYESRGALTSELLSDAGRLGGVLAARARGASKRFRQFAQNTDLLGHVAAALLAGHGDVPTIDRLTLERITSDLSEVQQARRWIRDARSSADRIRLLGASRARQSGRHPTDEDVELYRPTSPVEFFVRPGDHGWQLRLRVPDLTPLFARFPELAEEVKQVRCRVAGTGGRRRGQGWLQDSGQQVILREWPGQDAVIFELVRASAQATELFAAEARTPSYQPWLFRIGPDGVGHLVQSGSVRAGVQYILLGPNLEAPSVDWVSVQRIECEDVVALLVDMPQDIDPESTAMIRSWGCGVQTHVEISPVGFAPASWDGEGVGEWIVGDDPILRLSSTHDIVACTATLNDADRALISWEETVDNTITFELFDLDQGWHDLRLSFLVPERTRPIPDLRIGIRMREAVPERPDGTFRDPIRLRVTPQTAALEDVWDGRATVDADGQPGCRTSVSAALKGPDGHSMASRRFRVTLPVAPTAWANAFEMQVRGRSEFQRAYDDATQLEFVLGDDELGLVSVSLERDLVPLRWGFRRERDGTALRLYEAADTGGTLRVTRYPFGAPDISEGVPAEASDFYDADGGLFVAELDGFVARAILPPTVRDLQDLRSVRSNVRLRRRRRTAAGVMHFVELAELWSRSRSPGDLWVRDRRSAVEAAIKCEIGSLVGGRTTWAPLERRHLNGVALSIEELEAGLAKPSSWTAFRDRVAALASSQDMLVDPPVERFSAIVGDSLPGGSSRHLVRSMTAREADRQLPGRQFKQGGMWLSELLLRLSSDPGSLLSWANGRSELNFDEVLEHPHVFRAARMLAIVALQQGLVWEWA